MKLLGRRLQFSLLSLLLCTSFLGALAGIFVRRENWHETHRVRLPVAIGRVDAGNGGQITPDGKFVFLTGTKPLSITSGARTDVTAFDVMTGAQAATHEDDSGIFAISISPTGDRIAYCTVVDNRIRVRLWDWRRGAVIKSIDSETPNNIAFSPDGRSLLLHIPDSNSLDTKANLRLVPLDDSETVKSMRLDFRPILAYYALDGQSILALEANPPEHRAVLFDAKTLAALRLPPIKFYGELIPLAGGRDAVHFNSRRDLVRFDLRTGSEKWRVPTTRPDSLGTFTVSPDGTRLAYNDGMLLRIADLETGKTLDTTLRGVNTHRPRFLANGDLLVFDEPKPDSVGVHIFSRRYPEWWWGHFYRVEVWLAIIFGIAILVQLFRWYRRPMRREIS